MANSNKYYDATTDDEVANYKTCGLSSFRRCELIMQNNICVRTNLLCHTDRRILLVFISQF